MDLENNHLKLNLIQKEEESFDVNIGGDSEVSTDLFDEDSEFESIDSLNVDNDFPVDSTITK